MNPSRSSAPPAPRSIRSYLALALATVMLLTLVPPPFAQAAITTPQPDETVSGVVEIHEARGGHNGSGLFGSCSGAYTRVEVHQIVDGLTVEPPVFTETVMHPDGAGQPNPTTFEWDSVGEPNGEYRIRSFTADRNMGLLSCSALSAEVVRSDFTVTLQNWIGGAVRVPATHVTGEPLPVHVTSQDPTGTTVPGQDVLIEVDGVGEQLVTTDEEGQASHTFELPDLPAGDLTVTATTILDDPAFLPQTTTATLELLRRPTTITWTGDVRGNPGDTATLQGRITDRTPDSDRHGAPISDLEVTLVFEDEAATVSSDGDGYATRTVEIREPSREASAAANFGGTDVYAPSVQQISFFVGDSAAIDSPTHHALVGGLTRMVGTILTNPSSTVSTLTGYLDSLLTPLPMSIMVDEQLPLQPLDDVLSDTLGPVADNVGILGDGVDQGLDVILDGLGAIPGLGDLLSTLRFEWQSVYITPEGEPILHSFDALMGVPEPLDVTGDERVDVIANLTLIPNNDGGELPFTPTLRINKLRNAPEELPLSLQAIIGGDGLIQVGGEDGRLRFGYDSRTSSAPNEFRAELGLADGGFDIDVTTRGAHDIAVSGAIEGEGMDMPFGSSGSSSTEAPQPSFDEPIEPADVAEGETRFAIDFAPAPRRARIGLGMGGGSGDLGVNFDTSSPTIIGVDFIQDSGADRVSILGATFDSVDGQLALSLAAGETGSDAVAPDLGLQLQSPAGLDHLAVQARSLAGGQVTDDLLLSLTDVPRSLVFGVGDDGALGLTASEPVGVMEAGFASGGAISTLDEPAFLYMTTEDDYQSVGLRLLGVESLLVDMGDTLGLDLTMAPGPLRALVDSGEMGLDARIYDAPRQLLLGLAADGDFLIDGSDPIDLITLTVSDSSGILMGATSINARIEDIRSRLSVGLVGEGVSFDAGDHPIGLLDLFATSGPQPALPEGQDGLILNLSDEAFVMAARIHGLRNITADLDLESGAPSFGIDTVSNAIFNLDLDIAGIAIQGVIDHLVPNMRMGVAADEDGNLTGLAYSADRATNSLTFDIPGFATFTADQPLPARFEMGVGTGIVIKASEEFRLNLQAEVGDIEANITNLRSRVMEFGAGDLAGDYIPFEVNTTEWSDDCPDGCMYPIPSGTVRLGPIPLGSLNAFVNFTPGGIAARDATVFMELDESGLIPSARHVETVGELYCTPQTNLNATVQILITITIQMRDALCGGSSTQSNLSASLDAPPAVTAGDDVVHTLTARNQGPTAAANVQIDAVHNGALGEPTVSCPGGGTVSNPEDDAVRCTWSASTAANATRVMTLTWPTTAETAEGTRLEADYVASSTTAGSPASVSGVTVVSQDVAMLGLLALEAPQQVVAGYEDIQHRVDARNDGPSSAQDMRIDATYNDVLGAPAVTCSEGGVADGDACLWAGSTEVGTERWAAFVWQAPAGSGGSVLEAEYVVSSATAGGGATAKAATAVAAERADLEVVSVSAPERELPDTDLTHVVVTRNNGPSAADAMRILADYDPAHGVPEAVCSAGGVVSAFPEINRIRCLWLGASEAGSERTMELRWSPPENAPYGATVGASYRVTSNTAGSDARATSRTLIADPVAAGMDITSLSAPEVWAPGANLVHRIDVTNAGPEPAANMRVLASFSEGLGNPTVACSAGGTATQRVDDEAVGRCVWSGNTAAGTARFATLTWTNAQVTAAWNARDPEGDNPVVDVDYQVASDTPGDQAEASASTEILAAVANLFVQTATGPETVLRGSALTHAAGIRRGGPSGATNLVITGTYDPDLPAPNVTCSTGTTGGVVTPDPEQPNVRTCLWGSTTGTTTRTMTFSWPAGTTATMEPGTVVDSHFVATADTPGDDAVFAPSTEVTEPVARMSIQGVTGPAQVVAGEGQLQQRIDARNDGPQAANPMQLIATHDGRLGNPTVSCSSGGTAVASVDGEPRARCQWGNTTAGTARFMTVTWPVPADAETGAFRVDWLATGTVANGQVEEAGHVATAQIQAPAASEE